MMNSQQGRQKMSHLEHQINSLVLIIITIQVILCTGMAIASKLWMVNNNFDNIMIQTKYTENQLATISFFTYFLLLNTLLPISLQVCLEVCKFVQAFYINNDANMFSWDRLTLVEVKTASLVEELGQVNYIFSDKTGTLTRNVMEFKYMLVGELFYGDQAKFEQKVSAEAESETEGYKRMMAEYLKSEVDKNLGNDVNSWHCPNYNNIMKGSKEVKFEKDKEFTSKSGKEVMLVDNQKDLITQFMKLLSLAHSCEPEVFVDKDGKEKRFYNGPSPDEVELVQFANKMDFKCLESSVEHIKLSLKENGKIHEKEYSKFISMDFTSDRKRMSVLIRDPADNKLKLLVKGADSIIIERLDKSAQSS